jgi:hypothetical protein
VPSLLMTLERHVWDIEKFVLRDSATANDDQLLLTANRAPNSQNSMDRPASRGLLAGGVQKAPTGLSIDKPDRPSTALTRQQGIMPPGTAQGRPIGTANSRGGALGPPGTAMRRVLQSQTQLAGQAQARPLTQQGMGDMKPSTAAAGRQVLDRTYFINELRQKRQQTMTVIRQMQVRCVAHRSCVLMPGQSRAVSSPVCGSLSSTHAASFQLMWPKIANQRMQKFVVCLSAGRP